MLDTLLNAVYVSWHLIHKQVSRCDFQRVKELAQGQTASRWRCWESSSGLCDSRFGNFNPYPIVPISLSMNLKQIGRDGNSGCFCMVRLRVIFWFYFRVFSQIPYILLDILILQWTRTFFIIWRLLQRIRKNKLGLKCCLVSVILCFQFSIAKRRFVISVTSFW